MSTLRASRFASRLSRTTYLLGRSATEPVLSPEKATTGGVTNEVSKTPSMLFLVDVPKRKPPKVGVDVPQLMMPVTIAELPPKGRRIPPHVQFSGGPEVPTKKVVTCTNVIVIAI